MTNTTHRATHREWHLVRRPNGMPVSKDFALVETKRPEPGDGDALVRTILMSVDPYMRGRMNDSKSYAASFNLDEAMYGRAVGQVVMSRNTSIREGDYVLSQIGGFKEYFVSGARDLETIDLNAAPLDAWLGPMGATGMTAWVGLKRFGQPKTGETVFVSAASGAVGSVACQIARNWGCTVAGSAGTDEKVSWLTDTLGIRAFNYKKVKSVFDGMKSVCPDGIDVYFENVGGEHFEAALNLMNPFGRIVMCGFIDSYNDPKPKPGPGNLFQIITRSLRMEGFILGNNLDMKPDFREQMAAWISEGRMVWQSTELQGIDKVVEAFLGLFSGANQGKMMVRLGPDKT